MKADHYLQFYLGAETNQGILVGINQQACFVRSLKGETIEYKFSVAEKELKLVLKKINDLTMEESAELNRRGLSIGRPNGYSFTPSAILYLLSIRVDIFNLIGKGLAIDANG
ncbi:MAG: hypothetical protein ABJA57_00955 [Ginsengibacter sp.]